MCFCLFFALLFEFCFLFFAFFSLVHRWTEKYEIPNGCFLILFLFFDFSVLKICPSHSSFKSNSFFPSHFCTQAFNLHTAHTQSHWFAPVRKHACSLSAQLLIASLTTFRPTTTSLRDVKDLTPVRGQDGKISDTQGKDFWFPTRLRRVGDQ